ncbi:hypothetical protein Mapa_012485 [Marchantia paleacea]|nr:hypothetical protein Mapa_012485 [Marchantia paleacea]
MLRRRYFSRYQQALNFLGTCFRKSIVKEHQILNQSKRDIVSCEEFLSYASLTITEAALLQTRALFYVGQGQNGHISSGD